MNLSRRTLYPLGAAILIAYFLYFTHRGLQLYFDNDDMMNLYMAWSKPLGEVLKANLFFWSDLFRPFGALFYGSIFAVAGFNPVPFRVVALGLGIVNIALTFWFARLVSGSERAAALTALIFAFHSRLMEIWFRTAVIYDVLCYTFFYLALCVYIDARARGRHLGVVQSLVVLLCYVCALNSKEMAVSLPVVLLAYELLFHRRLSVPSLAFVAVCGLMALIYIIGKTHGPEAMTVNPGYRPEFTFVRFASNWSGYLGHLFLLRDPKFPVWGIFTLLAGVLVFAIVARSRLLVFAWVIIFTTMLPVSYIPGRGAFVLYIPYAGWALYAAFVLVLMQDAVTWHYPQFRTALACAVFFVVGWRWGKVNLHDQRLDPVRHWLYDSPAQVRGLAEDMRRMYPNSPPGARMLFLKDAFGTDEWTPVFVIRLLYRDQSLTVDRVKMMDRAPSDWSGYPYVFTYEDGKYRQVIPGPGS